LERLNPGEACKMALVCKQWQDAVTNRADLFWRDQCIKVGYWSSPESKSRDCTTDNQWFFYFAKRMMCRVRIRYFFHKYVAFLPRAGQLAFNPGASLPELDQAEHRLGARMPWELWELYRYRNGQAPASGVFWTDDTRLLCLSELQLEHRELGSNHQNFRTTAMEKLMSTFPLSRFPLSKDQRRPPPPASFVYEAGCLQGKEVSSTVSAIPCILFAENAAGNHKYSMDTETGCVLKTRGLTTTFFAPSLQRYIQIHLT